jgi:hypothetical protein
MDFNKFLKSQVMKIHPVCTMPIRAGRERQTDMTKLTGTFHKHANTLTVSFRDVFINDSTDGIQHSRLFSMIADRATNATIPSAVSGSPNVLVEHSTVNTRTLLEI